MPESRSLAFIASPASVRGLSSDTSILPLHPGVQVPPGRRLAARPEDLLNADDLSVIEAGADRRMNAWERALRHAALRWRDVDLGECFTGALDLGLRDAVKTAQVIERALERTHPGSVLTDVPPLEGAFPAYPYLSSMGTLLEGRARRDGMDFHSVAARSPVSGRRAPSTLAKAYVSLTARKGLRQLRQGHPLVGFGPYPLFFHPIARAARGLSREPMLAVVPAHRPIRGSGESGLSVLTLDAFLTPEDRRTIGSFTRQGLEAADALTAGSEPVENLASLIMNHLRSRLTSDLPEMAAVGCGFERGLDRAEGALVVETESPTARAFVRYARRAQVPVTVLQHGILAGAFTYGRTEGDRIAAWGPADAAWFRSKVGPSVRVEPTGSPRFDRLPAPRTPKSVEDLTPDRPVVFYASQPVVQDRPSRSAWDREEALRTALDAVAAMQGPVLVVKWHPSESEERLPTGSEGFARIVRGVDAMDVIRRSRVVLAVSSTVAFEAMLLARPVVFLGPADPTSPFHPPEDGAGKRALDSDDLQRHLRELIEEGPFREEALRSQREYLGRNYAPLDGRAAERVVHLATGR